MVAKINFTPKLIHVFFSPLKMVLSQFDWVLIGRIIQCLHRDAAAIGSAVVELQPLAE